MSLAQHLEFNFTGPAEKPKFRVVPAWHQDRDDVMRKLEEYAGARFRSAARAAVLEFLGGCPNREASSEDITDALKARNIVPPGAADDRAFGPIYFGLAKTGQIVKTGNWVVGSFEINVDIPKQLRYCVRHEQQY